ncbi:MAG TPA: SpoIID/LytB domain-containing protein, partial [Coriobacteriia bacterium]|nr:SpoIID/LytB domain-containing protein [Coriobacteriia bacterium]
MILGSLSLRRFSHALIALLAAAVLLPVAASAAAKTTFTINGGGWGHGIGMSQYGAQGYALKGWTHREILTHYYQDTEVQTKDVSALPPVQVNIDSGANARASWWITSGTGSDLIVTQYPEKNETITLDGSKSYWITTAYGNTRIRKNTSDNKPGDLIEAFDGECYVKSGSMVRMKSSSGPYNYANVSWRGTIHFVPSTSTTAKARNWVDIESYLWGVVPRESISSWQPAALRAQAVAARSYVYQDAKEKRAIYCTTMSQVYNGAESPGRVHEPASTTKAVNDTKGQVVWYGTETQPVKTFFFSSSGGRTANIEDVWTTSVPKPYYKSVSDIDLT